MKGTHIAQLPDALSAAQYGTYALGLPARKCRPANALDATHFRPNCGGVLPAFART
jgi:hypothetical protein